MGFGKHMKNKILLLFGIIILLVSCKPKEAEKQLISKTKPTTELKIEFVEKTVQVVIQEQFVENDSLTRMLKKELEKIALNSNFDLKVEPRKNKYDEKIIDTIKTLTFGKTKIYSYRAPNWESIYAAKIENAEFIFFDSIKIGIQKSILEYQFKIELENDLIKIGNLEQTSVFTFTFENDKLKTIGYQGYVD